MNLQRLLLASAVVTFLLLIAGGLPGCASNAVKETRTTFLSADDLVKMTDQMAQEITKNQRLAQVPGPLKIVIQPVINETNEIIRDNRREMFVQRLQGLLASNPQLAGRFIWIINQEDYQKLRREQIPEALLGPDVTSIQPEYALYAKFQVNTHVTSKGRSDSYLCTYFLTRLSGPTAREQIWSGEYETTKMEKKGFED